MRDFMRDYVRQQKQAVAYGTWFRHEVEQGRATAGTGDVLQTAEVDAEAEVWRAETRKRIIDEIS